MWAPVTCVYVTGTHIEILQHNHLLAGEELSLVLVDHSVSCGHFAVLIPSNWTQEVSWVGQTIGSCETWAHSIIYAHIFTHGKQTSSLLVITYGSQVREFKMGSIHLEDVSSGFSKHVHAEAHSLLDKTHSDSCYFESNGGIPVRMRMKGTWTTRFH